MEARVEALDLSGGLTRVLHLVDRPFVSSLTWHMSPPRSLLDICLQECTRWQSRCWILEAIVLCGAESISFPLWVSTFEGREHRRSLFRLLSEEKDVRLSFWNRRSIRVWKNNTSRTYWSSISDWLREVFRCKTPLCANVRRKQHINVDYYEKGQQIWLCADY